MLGPETVDFIRDLTAHNDRDWFKANEGRYKQHYKLAAEAFAESLAAELGKALGTPPVPRIFRIFRDVRFSKDKTPYNPHLRIGFSMPDTPPDHPMWMAGLELERLVVGVGKFGFEKATLERYREAVAGPAGDKLAELLAELTANGARLSEPDLKRVPAPYPQGHPRADLLRHKGLAVWRDHDGHAEAFGDEGPAKVAESMLGLRPVYDWLARLVS